MNELTETLIEEHKLIKRMIDILENHVNKIEKGEVPDTNLIAQAVDFIKNFADRFHHAKEEDILFKEMIKKGMPEKASPIEAMLIEHDLGRNFVKGILKGAEMLKSGESNGKQEIIKNAKGYIELLREHMDKEDNILYPLAERMCAGDKHEKERIIKEFNDAEEEKGGEETVNKYKKMVENLEK